MAKYSISEIGDMIGKGRQYVNTYKARGKIFIGEDGLFDTEHPMNKVWYAGLRKKHIETLSSGADVKSKSQQNLQIKAEQTPKLPKTPTKKVEQSAIDFDNEDEGTFYDKKAKAELELKLLAIKKAELDIQQKEGKLLNIDVAKDMVSAYMGTYSKGLFRDLETWMYKILDIHKIPLTDKTKYVGDLERIMNNASDRTMKSLIEKLSTENAQL